MTLHANSTVRDAVGARDGEHTECFECERLRSERDELEAKCVYLTNELILQNMRHMGGQKDRLFFQDYDGTFRINEAAFVVMDDHKRAIIHDILTKFAIPCQDE